METTYIQMEDGRLGAVTPVDTDALRAEKAQLEGALSQVTSRLSEIEAILEKADELLKPEEEPLELTEAVL